MRSIVRVPRFCSVGLSLSTCFVVACSGSEGGGGGTGGNAGSGGGGSGGGGSNGDSDFVAAPYGDMTFALETVEVDDPTKPSGVQGKLVRATDGTLYYVFLKFFDSVASCDIAAFGGAEAPGVNYLVKVAVQTAGAGAWAVETVPLNEVAGADDDFVNALFGVDAIVDASGQLVISVAAGGSGLASCGSSDLVVATRTGVDAYSFQTPVTASAACCTDIECDGDPACRSGTDVGAWATLAESPAGQLAVAYVDYHNFWDNDGQRFQGYEFWHESDGISGIRPWTGQGQFGDLVFSGSTAISAFVPFNGRGLNVLRRAASTGSKDDWVGTDLRPGADIGERVSLATGSGDLVGIAFHEAVDAFDSNVDDLVFCESLDGGENWETCETVDAAILALGFYPSLAFDSADRPVISYRVCGASGSCENNVDGVRMAWRELNGDWATKEVHSDNLTKSGTFTSLVLDPATDEPTIVFQDSTRGAAMVAKGAVAE